MREMIRDMFNTRDAMAIRFDIRVEELCNGYARVSMPVDQRHLNASGHVHGGASFAIADMACEAALAADNKHAETVSSSVHYLAPGKTGPLTAEGRIVSENGEGVSTVEVEVVDPRGVLIVRYMATGMRTGEPFIEF